MDKLIQFAVEEAIAAGIDTLIFVTGRNKPIEDHFDNHQELEIALRTKETTIKLIWLKISCKRPSVFLSANLSSSLGHLLCAERAMGRSFCGLVADDFITFEGVGVTGDLVNAFEKSGKTQLSAESTRS